MTGLPPWLVSDPAAPAQAYLRAFGQGAEIGESDRRAQIAAAELGQRREDAAFRRAQEDRMNQLRQTAQEFQLAQAGEEMRLKKEAAERAAATAARQLEAQKGLEAALAEGETLEKAMPRFLPGLLSGHAQSLPAAAKAIRPPQPPQWLLPGQVGRGSPGAFYNPNTGGTHVPAPEAVNTEVDYDGEKFIENSRTKGLTRVHPPKRTTSTAATEARILMKRLEDFDVSDHDKAEYTKQLNELLAELGSGEERGSAPPAASLPKPKTKGQKISRDEAKAFFDAAGKDPVRAAKLAEEAGFSM